MELTIRRRRQSIELGGFQGHSVLRGTLCTLIHEADGCVIQSGKVFALVAGNDADLALS